MEPIRFSVACTGDVKPEPKGNHRIRGGRFPKIYDSAKGLPAWVSLVKFVGAMHAPAVPIAKGTPVRMQVVFRLPLPKSAPKRRRIVPTTKPDLDKLYRSVGDALTGLFYDDDSQIIEMGESRKEYAYDGPVGCDIEISEALIP